MKRTTLQMIAFLTVFFVAFSLLAPVARAEEITDEEVLAVIAQLEAIDTLQQIQDMRSTYTVTNGRYDTGTTNTAIMEEHEAARAGYESYVNEMFAARIAAQQAYDALTEEQKAQIDADLVAKLSNYLPTSVKTGTYAVTPRDDQYTFEAVDAAFGQAYEVSNYMVSGNITQTFILVDTANGETSWTPSGKYVYGESNYDVTYCCDVQTALEYGTDYKRVNLEDSNYYGENSAKHIRAILQNAYPYLTISEMKASLKAGGLGSDFVDSLTRADMIAAVQMAVWTYANAGENDGALGYFASIDIPKNTGIYFTPLHDYTNECWEWLPGKRQRSYDARAEYRVNTLAYYLCNLEGVEAQEDQIVISDVEVTRADLLAGTDGMYRVGMYIYLNNGGSQQDDLKVTVSSYHTNEDGTVTMIAQSNQVVSGRTELEMSVKASSGDTIRVVLEGTQTLEKGVYFYEPEGGRDASQCLVGVAEGKTNVRAEETFQFVEEMGDMGLRIYKTDAADGSPLADIVFDIYRVVPGEGEMLNATPTEEEIAKYATEENLVGTVTTDATGYAAVTLEEGIYLIVEEHNTEKIKAPVSPFYIIVPMTETTENEDGTTSVETVNILSVYPKNETVTPPEEPPIIPPAPDSVTGKFQILKHDETDRSILLPGVQFAVYRAATAADTDTETILCGGIQYAVVPVTVDGEKLVLTTDENGSAVSPELSCDTYFLVELKAPAGYNLLDEAVSVTVRSSAMTTVTTVEIANQRGSILPETGGEGTKWLLMAGGFMTLIAAIFLVTKKRMGQYDMT